MFAVLTAVIKPLAFTVIMGITEEDPYTPTLAFTVANVVEKLILEDPLNAELVPVRSPVTPIVLPVLKVFAEVTLIPYVVAATAQVTAEVPPVPVFSSQYFEEAFHRIAPAGGFVIAIEESERFCFTASAILPSNSAKKLSYEDPNVGKL